MGKPLNKVIEVIPEEQQMEKGNFIIRTDRTGFMPERGIIKSIGKGVEDEDLVEGAKILFRKGAYSKVQIDGKDVLLMEEKNVFYIL